MREAVESYSKALCLDPFNWLGYRNRAHRHLSCWEFQEACSDFIMSTRLVPNTVDIHEIWEAWYLLALSHYLLGEYEKAADAYKTCYSLAHGDDIITTTGWYWSTLMRLGRKEEAENILAFITKDMKFEASREAYFSTLRMFKGWVSPEDTEAQCNMPDCKDKFTRLYAISNYYYITGDLETVFWKKPDPNGGWSLVTWPQWLIRKPAATLNIIFLVRLKNLLRHWPANRCFGK